MENSPSPAPEPQSLAELHAQNARELSTMFMGLARLGAEMVQIITERAREESYASPGKPTQLPEMVTAHDVMMRSLRRTGLMIQKLTRPAPAPREAGRSGDAAPRPAGRRAGESLEALEALEDVERLSDGELEALERLDAERDMAGRPLSETISTILKTVGVARFDGVESHLHLTPLEIAELVATRAGWSLPRRAGRGDRRDDGAGADGMRGNGATGCRDP